MIFMKPLTAPCYRCCLTGDAGFPATVTPWATSLVTTEQAPTIARSPIVTPGRTKTRAPMKAWEPILMGRHLIEMGLPPGPGFKEILDAVYEMQLDGKVSKLDEALTEAKRISGSAT